MEGMGLDRRPARAPSHDRDRPQRSWLLAPKASSLPWNPSPTSLSLL